MDVSYDHLTDKQGAEKNVSDGAQSCSAIYGSFIPVKIFV